jgi:hypothetical protein
LQQPRKKKTLTPSPSLTSLEGTILPLKNIYYSFLHAKSDLKCLTCRCAIPLLRRVVRNNLRTSVSLNDRGSVNYKSLSVVLLHYHSLRSLLQRNIQSTVWGWVLLPLKEFGQILNIKRSSLSSFWLL